MLAIAFGAVLCFRHGSVEDLPGTVDYLDQRPANPACRPGHKHNLAIDGEQLRRPGVLRDGRRRARRRPRR